MALARENMTQPCAIIAGRRADGARADSAVVGVCVADDPKWLQVARDAAARAATAEARHQWGLGPRSAVPFNYRLEHIQSVVRIAESLVPVTGADSDVVIAAAWIHDIAKGFHEEPGDGHGRRGALRAQAILRETDFPPEKLEAVGRAITAHVGLFRDAPPSSVEEAVLFDADKLSKLGATAVIHFLCCYPAGSKGGHDLTKDVALALAQWESVAGRIVQSLCTEPAQTMGRERLAFLHQMVTQLRQEHALPADGADDGSK